MTVMELMKALKRYPGSAQVYIRINSKEEAGFSTPRLNIAKETHWINLANKKEWRERAILLEPHGV